MPCSFKPNLGAFTLGGCPHIRCKRLRCPSLQHVKNRRILASTKLLQFSSRVRFWMPICESSALLQCPSINRSSNQRITGQGPLTQVSFASCAVNPPGKKLRRRPAFKLDQSGLVRIRSRAIQHTGGWLGHDMQGTGGWQLRAWPRP